MKAIIRLIRPYQWIKNSFVFLAMIFGGGLLDPECWIRTIIGAIAFCFCSSAVYCLNDILDREYDRLDPEKKSRPVASGAVTVTQAAVTGAVMATVSLGMAWLLSCEAVMVVLAYLALNIVYSLWIKHITMIDVISVALCFVLRVVMGGVAGGIPLSQWIIIMVFLLSMFLALAKRRHEIVLVESCGKAEGRSSVAGYNLRFIDLALCILASVMLVGYIIYSVLPSTVARFGTGNLYITSLFVLCGILRYLQLTVVMENSGNPSRTIYHDRPLQLAVTLWLVSFIMIIYG